MSRIPLYQSPQYPETFGELADWATGRVSDPEKKVLFRMSDDDLAITYSEFRKNINRIANLLEEMGVEGGDHVATFLPNCHEYAYLFHAIGKCAAVMVPIIQFVRGESLKYIINHSDTKFLITTSMLFVDKLAGLVNHLPHLKCIIFIDEIVRIDMPIAVRLLSYQECSTEYTQKVSVSGSDIQGIWYTSGTTGLPKGVMIPHRAYLYRAFYFADYFRLNAQSVNYYVLPMYHSGYPVLGAPLIMAHGGEIVQVRWFSASAFWSDIVKYRVTLTASTGTVIPIMQKQTLSEQEVVGRDLVKVWIGWPVGEEEAVKERWPGIKFIEIYGTTEAPIATVSNFEEPELGNAGPPALYTDLRLVNPESGEDVIAARAVGEIAYKHKLGPDYIIREYYKEPAKTKEMIKDGYWHSGDLGMIDERGYLHFVDRLKDYVRIGGENVSSAVVEDTIRRHPAVAEVAIVGVSNELGHDEMVAHVVLKENVALEPEAFFVFCNEQMSYFMVPRFLVLRSELPKTGTLRIEKYKLREEGVMDAIDRVQLGIVLKK